MDSVSLSTFNSRNEVATYERNQLDNFWSSDDYYGFMNTFKYDKEKITLDKYTIIEETRTRVVYSPGPQPKSAILVFASIPK